METGKTGKYFKYAIGEIILVVIGILIALQINNWNEDKKKKTLAHQYVKGLVRDLKQDTVSINMNIQFHKQLIKGLDTLISLKKKDLKDPTVNSSFHLLYRKYCTRTSIFEISENTLTQLKNTGDLALFDERVKDSIISYELLYQSVKSQGNFYEQAYKNNDGLGKKIIDYTILLDTSYFYNRSYTGKKLPTANFTKNLTREFFNEAATVRGTSKLYLNSYLLTNLKKAENLIALLEKEHKLDEND